MSQHTPGPWAFRKGNYTPKWREDTYLVETGNLEHQEGGQIAHMCLEANARLIAAAPEMLDALHWILSFDMMPTDFPNEGDMIAWCEQRAGYRALLARIEGDSI